MPRHDPSEKTKLEILRTAVRLFREQGWKSVTIEDVVKEVGVTRGAFYHYFKSREELVMAVTDQMFLDDNPFALAAKERGLNAHEKLRFVMKLNMNANMANIEMVNEVQRALDNPAVFKGEFFSQVNTVAPYLEKLLVEGNADGSLSVRYPKQAAQVLALLPGMWLNPAVLRVSYEELVEKLSFLEHLMESLGVPPFIDNEIKEQALKHYEAFWQN